VTTTCAFIGRRESRCNRSGSLRSLASAVWRIVSATLYPRSRRLRTSRRMSRLDGGLLAIFSTKLMRNRSSRDASVTTAGMVVSPGARNASTLPWPQTRSNYFPSASGSLRRTTVMGFLRPTSRILATIICHRPRLRDLGFVVDRCLGRWRWFLRD
jgi:hypothetical protein